ncbi:MAG: inositol monophosphatase [Lentisphaeria bacterium]|nr:inositol monophosphatase [Lentisphaeria bacterium]
MLEFIRNTIRKAGDKSLEYFGNLSAADVSGKSAPNDLVSIADKAVEELIISEIIMRFPEHGIYGEESGRSDSDSPYCWVIDPIDGTQNFVNAHHYYCISIALFFEGSPVYGCIYAPVLGKMYYAAKGKGAFCNGKPIRARNCDALNTATCATGFATFRINRPEPTLTRFCQIATKLRDVKRCGSAALDLAFVASGIYDGFWEEGLGLYDVGAGMLIAAEAGAVVCDYDKGQNIPENGIIAAAQGIVDDMINCLKLQK